MNRVGTGSLRGANRMARTLPLPTYELSFTSGSITPGVGSVAPTTVRAGNTATVVNSTGAIAVVNANLPRFDYDPITLVCKGLLIEEARTNLIIYSNTLDGPSGWVPLGATFTANGTSSPPIALYRLNEDTGAAEHGLVQTVTSGAGNTVSASVIAKASQRSWLRIRLIDSPAFADSYSVWFNLSTGVVGTKTVGGAATLTSASIEDMGNGFYRCKVTAKLNAGSANVRMDIFAATGDNNVNYQGVNGSGLFLGAVQAEVGAFSTSYIPTAGATATRAVDMVTLATTNLPGFSATEGTMVCSATRVATIGVGPAWAISSIIDDGTNLAYIAAAWGNVDTAGFETNADGNYPIGTGAIVPTRKIAGGWKAGASQIYGFCNSDDPGYGGTSAIPTVNTLRFGTYSDGTTSVLNGWIVSFQYYPVRYANSMIQTLSQS